MICLGMHAGRRCHVSLSTGIAHAPNDIAEDADAPFDLVRCAVGVAEPDERSGLAAGEVGVAREDQDAAFLSHGGESVYSQRAEVAQPKDNSRLVRHGT